MSVLLPETRRMLAYWAKTCPANPVVRVYPQEIDDHVHLSVRQWMATRSHTAECRCRECRADHQEKAA